MAYHWHNVDFNGNRGIDAILFHRWGMMGALLKILIIFTVINSGFFVLNLSNNAASGSPISFLQHFTNVDPNQPSVSTELTSATTTDFQSSPLNTGTSSSSGFNFIDALWAIIPLLNLLLGLITGFLTFCVNVGMPAWFTYMVAVPMTMAYWVSLGAMIRGVLI